MTKQLARRPALWAISLFVVLVLIVAHLSVFLVTPRDPWHDEAQLATNIVAEKLNLLQAFPYYEQAAPIGYTAIARTALQLPIDKFQTLRLTSVVGFVIGLVTLAILIMRAFCLPVLLMFGALVLSSDLLWRYATEIKHYGFEFTATSLLLLSGWELSRSDKLASHVGFVITATIAALISFTAPIALASVVGGIVASRSRVLDKLYPNLAKDDGAPPLFSPRLAVSFAMAFAVVVGMYVFVNRGLVYWQFTSFDFWYNRNRFGLDLPLVENARAATGFLTVLLEAFGYLSLRGAISQVVSNTKLLSGVTALLGATFLTVMTFAALRRATFFALTLVAFICVAFVLNWTGKLPFLYFRHFLFIVPLMLIIVSVGAIECMRRLGHLLPSFARVPGVVLVSGVLIFTSVHAMYAAAMKREQEVTPLFAEIVKQNPDAPVWVYAGMQPAALLLAPPNIRFVGMFDKRSSNPSWIVLGGGMFHDTASDNPWQASPTYPQSIIKAASGQKALWLIFGHDWMEASHNPYLEVAEAVVGQCRIAAVANPSTIYQTTLYYCAEKAT